MQGTTYRSVRCPADVVLLLDTGSYEPLPSGGRRLSAEIVPLSRLMNVDGRYYALTVPRSGGVCRPAATAWCR
jgi:hypothetical protein